jgi:hypothetical protein
VQEQLTWKVNISIPLHKLINFCGAQDTEGHNGSNFKCGNNADKLLTIQSFNEVKMSP